MGPIGCQEASVRNYHYSLRNNPESAVLILCVIDIVFLVIEISKGLWGLLIVHI